MSRGAKISLFVVIAVVVVGGLVMLGKARGGNGATEVRLEQVGRRDLVAAVTASGQIEAKTQVDISSEVTARILKIHVKEGDMVKPGELLVELDQAQFKGAVDRAQAGIAQSNASVVQATANRDQAKRTLDRQRELKKSQPNLVTDESVELANQLSTIEGIITLECGPISRIEAPSSRTLAMNSSSHVAIRPGISNGTVTVRVRNVHEAPHICAHSSRLLSICSITPAIVRTPSGRNTVR